MICRCYYKCSSFANCPAKKYVEKSKTHENAYIVTYKGEHDHQKPEEIKNFVVGTSHNKMMLKFDEPETSNSQVFSDESKISCSETEFIGNSNDDDDILIPNITAMSEDLLMDFNHLNSGALFP
jgi:hypothetical protein